VFFKHCISKKDKHFGKGAKKSYEIDFRFSKMNYEERLNKMDLTTSAQTSGYLKTRVLDGY